MIETPEQRHERGYRLAYDSCSVADYAYVAGLEKKLTSSERAQFRLEFFKARASAGIRGSADLALAEMRAKLMQRLGKPSWRAAT